MIAAIPDGTCDTCLAGYPAVCEHQLSMGYQFGGGFAEYLIVPPEVLRVDGLNRIPDGLSYAEASVAEPLACVLNGQELARVGPGIPSWWWARGRSAACTCGSLGRGARAASS